MEDVTALFHRYKDPVYRLALSFTGSPADAEDVTQTVFLKYLETQPELEAGKEKAWLLQVTANQCRDLWRRLKRRAAVPLEEAQAVAVLPPRVEAVAQAVRKLKPTDRAAVYLFYYEGYSTGEIAGMLRMNQSAITSRLHRARKKLRILLEQEGYYETRL